METTPQEFKEKVKNEFLVMSRVNPQTRKEFVEFSNMDFCGDYGQALYHIWEQFKEYQLMKQTIFADISIKLNNIIELIENQDSQSSKVDEKEIRLLNGKKLKGGINKE